MSVWWAWPDSCIDAPPSRQFRLCFSAPQMAVSQNTVVVCPLAVGGAEYGGGCFLFQLGRMGILSCLYRFFSGRWRALISRHKMRFFSIISIMVASPQSHGIWKQQCKGQRLRARRRPPNAAVLQLVNGGDAFRWRQFWWRSHTFWWCMSPLEACYISLS